MKLEEFNEAPRSDAVDVLAACADIGRWCGEIADGRPFPSVDAVLTAARSAADPFADDEIEQALSHHPRIGESHTGGAASAEATMSASEQSGVDETDAGLASALAAGNREYEQKFERVFLIRAAGRSAAEILESLRARLQHTAEEEDRVVAEQLRQIALLRLEGVITA